MSGHGHDRDYDCDLGHRLKSALRRVLGRDPCHDLARAIGLLTALHKDFALTDGRHSSTIDLIPLLLVVQSKKRVRKTTTMGQRSLRDDRQGCSYCRLLLLLDLRLHPVIVVKPNHASPTELVRIGTVPMEVDTSSHYHPGRVCCCRCCYRLRRMRTKNRVEWDDPCVSWEDRTGLLLRRRRRSRRHSRGVSRKGCSCRT